MAIKNIIFDLGGVVLNLDQERTLRAFKRLGLNLESLNLENPIFTDFEVGKIDGDTFIHTIHSQLKGEAEKSAIVDAWNAMLLDLPLVRLEIIRNLKKNYRIFLLSNTNQIHIDSVYHSHGKAIFEELFEVCYLSHEIGHRKPNASCYEFVLNQSNLIANESLFIDDNKANLKGAQALGIHTIWAKDPIDQWLIEELNKLGVQ